jgi:hypothetical protein
MIATFSASSKFQGIFFFEFLHCGDLMFWKNSFSLCGVENSSKKKKTIHLETTKLKKKKLLHTDDDHFSYKQKFLGKTLPWTALSFLSLTTHIKISNLVEIPMKRGYELEIPIR